MNLVDERLVRSEGAGVVPADRRVGGEGGVEHLRVSVEHIAVASLTAAEELLQELAELLSVKVPTVLYTRRAGTTRGLYQAFTQTITMRGNLDLSVLMHELAHHVDAQERGMVRRQRNGKRDSHGPTFKLALDLVYRALATATGLVLKTRAARAQVRRQKASHQASRTAASPTVKPGDKIRVKGLAGPATVVRKLRTRWEIRSEDGRIFRCPVGCIKEVL